MNMRAALPLAMACAALSPVASTAQIESDRRAEAFVSSNHWSRAALRRLAAFGLIDGGEAIDAWPLRRSEIRALFVSAVAAGQARGTTGPAADMFAAFETEYARPLDGSSFHAAARVRSGWAGRHGTMLGGTSVRDPSGKWSYPGPVRATDPRGPFAGLDADVTWRVITAAIRTTADEQSSIDEASLAIAAGPIDIRAGRIDAISGIGSTGGIVATAGNTLDGVAIRTARSIDMPGFLSFLGGARGSLLLSRMARSGYVERPWYSAASISFSPSGAFRFGLNRAVLFGGDGNVQRTSARNVALMVLGITSQLGKDSGFENQVASIDAWLRTTPGGLPVAWYGELAVDDVGFSLFTTAAFVAGVEIPSLPFLPALSIGIEHARFPQSCCGHPPWYRHGDLGDGWTDGGRLLGHPLGGHGSEWRFDWSAAGSRTQIGGALFVRQRGSENLFAPDRQGSSTGMSVRGDFPVSRNVLIRASVAHERGQRDWSAWTGEVGARLLIGALSSH